MVTGALTNEDIAVTFCSRTSLTVPPFFGYNRAVSLVSSDHNQRARRWQDIAATVSERAGGGRDGEAGGRGGRARKEEGEHDVQAYTAGVTPRLHHSYIFGGGVQAGRTSGVHRTSCTGRPHRRGTGVTASTYVSLGVHREGLGRPTTGTFYFGTA